MPRSSSTPPPPCIPTLQLSIFDALLGARLPVATMRGQQLLAVPPGTQHGSLLRVANAGVPRAANGVLSYGHHFFSVSVRVPSPCEQQGSPRGQQRLTLLRRLHQLLSKQQGGDHHPRRQQQQEGSGPRQQQAGQQHHQQQPTDPPG